MKSTSGVTVLGTLLFSMTLAGGALAGGGRPAPSSPTHELTVLQETNQVRARVADTLRILMEEAPYEDGRHWRVLNSSAGLQLLTRSETPQGDHGYSSLIFYIAYVYKVLPSASGTLTLRFTLTPDDPMPPGSQILIRQLTVKVVR